MFITLVAAWLYSSFIFLARYLSASACYLIFLNFSSYFFYLYSIYNLVCCIFPLNWFNHILCLLSTPPLFSISFYKYWLVIHLLDVRAWSDWGLFVRLGRLCHKMVWVEIEILFNLNVSFLVGSATEHNSFVVIDDVWIKEGLLLDYSAILVSFIRINYRTSKSAINFWNWLN